MNLAELLYTGLFGVFFTCLSGIIAFYAKDFVGNVKALTVALNANAAETKRLAQHVERLDAENTSLRKSHNLLTRYLISKGILPPPDPNSI